MDDHQWVEELGMLLEADISAVYPVPNKPADLDFIWLADSYSGDEDAVSMTPPPISPLPSTDSDESNEPDEITETDVTNSNMNSTSDNNEIDCALQQNRACQIAIKEMIDAIESEISNLSKSFDRLRDIKQRNPSISKEGAQLLNDPFGFLLKKAESGKLELPSEYITSYRLIHRDHLKKAKSYKWSRGQRRKLATGVRQQNQKILMDRVMERGGGLTEIQAELNNIKSMSERDLELNLDGLDYAKISRLFVSKKSPNDCEIQWKNVDYPGLNKSDKWTAEEVSLLKRSTASWSEIGRILNRPPHACLQEYQRRFHPHGNRGKWSAEEDDALKKAVEQFGASDWSRIALLVPGRTSHQCFHRYRKAFSQPVRRGRWTLEEDNQLRTAISANPDASWQTIAANVPGRTDIQCRERWANVLDPTLIRGKFSQEEDEQLAEAVHELGVGKWAAVAARIPGRTDNVCRRRWNYLFETKGLGK